MIVLVDADTLAYKAAFSKESTGVGSAIDKIDSVVEKIKETVNPYLDSESIRFYLTGKGNFRYGIDKDYKGNRKGTEKPLLLPLIRNHLVDAYNAVVVDGMEADDAIAIEASKHDWHDVVIVSIDKDFRTVPCQLYNPGRDTWESIDPWSAKVNFYQQILVGDTSDNIIGVYKVGPVKAKAMLGTCETEREMWEVCLEAYHQDYQRCRNNAKLLYLLRSGDDDWEPPE